MTATFDDPDFTAQSRGSLGPDGINALSLYGTYSGAGVRVGVVDTGIRWDDPELVGQVDTTGGWNASPARRTPTPMRRRARTAPTSR
jgi:hypothetical protein